MVAVAVALLVLYPTVTFVVTPDWGALQRVTPDRLRPMVDVEVGPRTLALSCVLAGGFLGGWALPLLHRLASGRLSDALLRTGRPVVVASLLAVALLGGALGAALVYHPALGLLVLLAAFSGGAGTAAFVRCLSGLLVVMPVGGVYLLLTGDLNALAAQFPLRSGASESIPYAVIIVAIMFAVALMGRYRPVPLGSPGTRLHRLTRSVHGISWALSALVAVVGVLALHGAVGAPAITIPLPAGPGYALAVMAIVVVPILLLLALVYAVAADLDEAHAHWKGPDRWMAPLALARSVARVVVVVSPLAYGLWLGLLAAPEPASSQVRDRDGNALGVRREAPAAAAPDIAIPLALPATEDDIPDVAYEALEATEDIGSTAGSAHPGVQPISLLRVASQILSGDGGASGGSGIAAQVIKRETGRPIAALAASVWPRLGGPATMLDKLLVEFPAAWTFQAVSDVSRPDQDPMTVWLNNVDLGHNTRGIRAAAWRFFGDRLDQLSVAEVATLIGMANAPSALDPYRYADDLLDRRNEVLDRMGAQGYLTADEVAIAQAEPLVIGLEPFEPNEQIVAADALIDHAMLEGQALGFDDASRAGRTYQITMDQGAQWVLELSVATAIDEARIHGVNDAAAVVIDARTGELLAYSGGQTYGSEEGATDDMVSAIPHQPGSAIKPFVYACALQLGALKPDGTVRDDAGIARRLGVANHDHLFWGELPWQLGLSESRNVPAAELVDRMTAHAFAACLRDDFGFTSYLDPDRYGVSLGLGLAPVTMLELANAYSILAAGGLDLPLTSLVQIEDRYGEVVYESDPETARAMRCSTVGLVAEALRPVGERYGLAGWSAKTGTTAQSSVVAGFNADRILVAWLGNSEPVTGTPRALDEQGVDGAAGTVLRTYAATMGQSDMAPATGCGGTNAQAGGSQTSLPDPSSSWITASLRSGRNPVARRNVRIRGARGSACPLAFRGRTRRPDPGRGKQGPGRQMGHRPGHAVPLGRRSRSQHHCQPPR